MVNQDAIHTDVERWLIVTDLDGTLLDHFTYSHDAVDSLLAKLEVKNVPVIFNSSKTFPEMLQLREELNNRHPFIVENGSAIYLPDNYFANVPKHANLANNYWTIPLGAERQDLVSFLHNDAQQYSSPYLSFSNASMSAIINATGLGEDQVINAMERQFSEPILWQGSDEEKAQFIQRVRRAGFHTLQGGRFLHLLGNCDKGRATEYLRELYRENSNTQSYRVVAAGDSPNDIDMLMAADTAVIIRSPTHDPMQLHQHARVVTSKQLGPQGWTEVISKLFFPNDQ